MKFTDLDFNSIIKMYQKAKNETRVEEITIIALDNYSFDSKDKKYDFLYNMTLPLSTIKRYQESERVLCLLASKQVEPKTTIWGLILEICSCHTILELAKNGFIPTTYFETAVIKSKNIKNYFSLFNQDELNINIDSIVESFLKLEPNLKDKTYLDCIKLILTKFPYNAKNNLKLVEIICQSSTECLNTIKDIISNIIEQVPNEFESTMKQRPDLLYLLKYLQRTDKAYCHYIPRYIETYFAALKEIKMGNVRDIAWYIFLYQIPEKDRIAILNCWANRDNVVAFDTYFGYFTSDNLDYENVGAALDTEYQSKISNEDLQQNITRERKQKDDKIPSSEDV